MDFSLGTRPAKNPNLTAFDESPGNSFITKQIAGLDSLNEGCPTLYENKVKYVQVRYLLGPVIKVLP